MSARNEERTEEQIAQLMQKLDLTDSARQLAMIEAMIAPLCPSTAVAQQVLSAIMDYGNLVAQEQEKMGLMAAIGDEEAQRLCSLVESPVEAPFVPGDGELH